MQNKNCCCCCCCCWTEVVTTNTSRDFLTSLVVTSRLFFAKPRAMARSLATTNKTQNGLWENLWLVLCTDFSFALGCKLRNYLIDNILVTRNLNSWFPRRFFRCTLKWTLTLFPALSISFISTSWRFLSVAFILLQFFGLASVFSSINLIGILCTRFALLSAAILKTYHASIPFLEPLLHLSSGVGQDILRYEKDMQRTITFNQKYRTNKKTIVFLLTIKLAHFLHNSIKSPQEDD